MHGTTWIYGRHNAMANAGKSLLCIVLSAPLVYALSSVYSYINAVRIQIAQIIQTRTVAHVDTSELNWTEPNRTECVYNKRSKFWQGFVRAATKRFAVFGHILISFGFVVNDERAPAPKSAQQHIASELSHAAVCFGFVTLMKWQVIRLISAHENDTVIWSAVVTFCWSKSWGHFSSLVTIFRWNLHWMNRCIGCRRKNSDGKNIERGGEDWGRKRDARNN